jgi:uncharacterized spore protein YtfJ
MNVDQMLKGAQDALTVRRVYGDPIERDGVLVIPAAAVSGGGGGGGDAEQNGGGGFGLSAKPAGAYVVKGGDVSWVPAVDVNRIVIGAQVAGIVLLLVVRSIFKSMATRR